MKCSATSSLIWLDFLGKFADRVRTLRELPHGSRAMYFRKKTSGGRAYLQIVESRREGAAVRQQVIATLGRVEDLRESGQLERLLRSGARFAEKAIVVDALAAGSVAAGSARRIGPALVFERLWEETGCRDVVESLASSRKYDFRAGTRAGVRPVLHRLFCGGSDRAATAGGRITASTASRASTCITSIGRWPGLARNWRKINRTGPRPSRRVA